MYVQNIIFHYKYIWFTNRMINNVATSRNTIYTLLVCLHLPIIVKVYGNKIPIHTATYALAGFSDRASAGIISTGNYDSFLFYQQDPAKCIRSSQILKTFQNPMKPAILLWNVWNFVTNSRQNFKAVLHVYENLNDFKKANLGWSAWSHW